MKKIQASLIINKIHAHYEHIANNMHRIWEYENM